MSTRMSQDEISYAGHFDLAGNWVPDDPRSMPNAHDNTEIERAEAYAWAVNEDEVPQWKLWFDMYPSQRQ